MPLHCKFIKIHKEFVFSPEEKFYCLSFPTVNEYLFLFKGIDLFNLREYSVFGGSFEMTTPPRVRHLGIRHRCHSKEEILL